MKNFFYGKVYRRAGRLNFTLIELLVVKTCQIYHSSLVCTGLSREGFGGEKAAGKAASLPVPNNHQTIIHQPITAPQQSFRSASGEVEQKREWVFPQKSGKSRSRFGGSFPLRRPTAAESDSDPYAAPAPCRTPGVRGAAETPPASHSHATLPREASCRTPGVRGRRTRPPLPTTLQRSGRRKRPGLPLDGNSKTTGTVHKNKYRLTR